MSVPPGLPKGPLYGTPSSGLLQSVPTQGQQPVVWGVTQTAQPSQMLLTSPMNTAQSTPAVIAPYSAQTGPKQTAAQCPDKAGGTPPAKTAPAKPKKPCDARSLTVTVTEGDDTITLETLPASAGRPTQRPRELKAPNEAPTRIRVELSGHDLVIETIGHAPGSSWENKANVEKPTNYGYGQKRTAMDREYDEPKDDEKTTLAAKATWDAKCADPAHARITLNRNDGKGALPLTGEPALEPLPLTAVLSNLDDFIFNGLDPRVLGRKHVVEMTSCGAPASGPATTWLRALVIAYPKGATGVKITLTAASFSIGWYTGELEEEQTRLKKGIVDAEQTGARWAKKAKSGPARQRNDYKAKLKSKNQELVKLKNKLEQIEGKRWEGPEFSWAVIVFDKEIDPEKQGAFGSIMETIKTLREKFDRAKSLMENINKVLKFARDYTPSLVQPIATIEATILEVEVFVGFQLSTLQVQSGPRYRALGRSLDIEINSKLIELSGSLGVSVGKRLLGTGATVDVLVTISANIELSASFSAKEVSGLFNADNWKSEKPEIVANWKAGGQLIGKIEVFTFPVAKAAGAIQGSGTVTPNGTLGEFLKGLVRATLTVKPLIGHYEYSIAFFKKPERKTYTLWEGGTYPL